VWKNKQLKKRYGAEKNSSRPFKQPSATRAPPGVLRPFFLPTRALRRGQRARRGRHALYAPLRELWLTYVARATEGLTVGDDDWVARLVQSDLHGAELHVTHSRDAARLGKHGTVVMDTPNAFHLMSPNNRLLGARPLFTGPKGFP
jgi:hypothetical protein